MSREPIGVIGVGYVGLVTAACFADLGHTVICRDIDPAKVEMLRGGAVPMHEPGLDDLIRRNRNRLRFTLDLDELFSDCRLAFICVDTPPMPSGDADLSRVQSVIDAIPPSAEGAGLVMKSTVPVGTGENVRLRLDARGLQGVAYMSNPEFLREGSAVSDFMAPDRVVVGADSEEDAERVARLYDGIDTEIVRTDVASAEMIKLAANAFLATKISFINEIANVCEAVGADVAEVARGMGLDRRIGASFLRPGIGYGGSCLVGDETVLARRGGATRLVELETLHAELGGGALIEPEGLEVLSWRAEGTGPEFLPVSHVTSRQSDALVEVRTKMGRRVTVTDDHPFVVVDGVTGAVDTRLARDLTEADWLPIAQGSASAGSDAELVFDLRAAAAAAGIADGEVIARLAEPDRDRVGALGLAERQTALVHHRGSITRINDIRACGAVRCDEADALGLTLDDALFGTARNGTYVPGHVVATEALWTVLGLYIAEGHVGRDGARERVCWSFHPTDEADLVDRVASYWRELGVKTTVRQLATTCQVSISSRILAAFIDDLGLGRNAYSHAIPDAIWARPIAEKRALLAGLWLGDGSWSYINRGPSVILEYGTVSRPLADGMLRLLGECGIVARMKVGRTAKSTCDTYWLMVSGADQVETMLDLVPEADTPAIRASIAAQAKRIAPTGFRRDLVNGAVARVTSVLPVAASATVYSLEVPDAHTFVTTGGLVVHNCFPKDVRALKQLAGNSGYHFQLLTAVIEVNELQKRRVISKLQHHLGSLRDKKIALLGIAFKPNTDDTREASSLVLAVAARRRGGGGARVRPRRHRCASGGGRRDRRVVARRGAGRRRCRA